MCIVERQDFGTTHDRLLVPARVVRPYSNPIVPGLRLALSRRASVRVDWQPRDCFAKVSRLPRFSWAEGSLAVVWAREF